MSRHGGMRVLLSNVDVPRFLQQVCFLCPTPFYAASGEAGFSNSSRAHVRITGCKSSRVIRFAVYVGATCVCVIAVALWRFQNKM